MLLRLESMQIRLNSNYAILLRHRSNPNPTPHKVQHSVLFAATLVNVFEPIRAPRTLVKNYPSSASNTRVNARIVTDASGFSRKLTGKFSNKELFPGYNCDAYWAYFRSKGDDKAESRLQRWDYPVTKHMCFPEGWGWFIKLISWEHAPLTNLMDMCAFLIDNARRSVLPTQVPCTAKLSHAFSCPYEYITSIGWAVRNDYKFSSNLASYGATDTERKFMYFQCKYPTLNKLMNDVYELLPSYYEKQTYFVCKGMTYRSPVVSGNGWFAIGNSAGFTNPLISPGINAGIETEFLAAKFTNDIFVTSESRALTVMRAKSKEYQTYSHDYMVLRKVPQG
ncbi:hypothetical protein GGX14DRAFT_611028 [Mycena pura]|uniref:Uncharacterized protein n=1 Tax=Mycena pura TaxID=153505 RepID=A0AAD6VKU3_9AGAR|nr:hypothetical protein GGX14DRAFT_611028 [Mycena pura]